MYGIRPTKGKGQNFLIDESMLDIMIAAAAIRPTDFVVEIGPGLGVLTHKLLNAARRVVAVELDRSIATFVRAEFGTINNFELIEDDILRVRNDELVKRLGSPDYKVVANIPYAITAPVIEKFLSYEPKPACMVLMVQKEVAERITAKPGEMSMLAVAVQYYANAEIIATVPRASFYPAPEVDSAILKITVNHRIPDDSGFQKDFFRTVRIGFSARRKQLHNNLSAGLRITSTVAKELLVGLGLREDVRAQNLSVDDWKRLTTAIISQKNN